MTDRSLFARDVPILVVGDVILDGFSSGTVDRLSPEAPVPVLRHVGRHEVPGGGANVAMNIASLGGQAHLIGLIGADEEGRRLQALLDKGGVETGLIVAGDRPTTSKVRILAGTHQLMRIDKEETCAIPSAVEEALLVAISAALPTMKALILSDYNKGSLSDRVLRGAIEQARALNIPVFVDPKRQDFTAYAGATFITPNRAELAKATGIICDGDEACREAARRAGAITAANILLTRSEQGMSLFPLVGEEISVPSETREIFDVSGAGDTVVATFALAIACGHGASEALRLANNAARVVIGKSGTATLTQAELLVTVERPRFEMSQPISWAEVQFICDRWKQDGLRVGFTNGCFDLLHPGHVALLREAADHCDRLVVGLNSDESVRRLKGPTRPVQSEGARGELLCAIRHVDLVVIFTADTPLELISWLKPDLLVKGSDYSEDEIVGAELVKASGGRVLRVELREGHSTTNMIARMDSPQDAAA